MREATLGGVSALDARPSGGAARPRSPAARRNGKGLSPRLRRVRAHLALVVGSAGFSAIMIGIILNATVMQKEHHPAPLFGGPAAPAHVAATAPDTGVALIPPLSAPSSPVAPSPVASPPMVTAAPLPEAVKGTAHVPQTTPALHAVKPVDGIARFLSGSHGSRPVVVAHGSARPVSTQPKTAAAAKPRPLVPVAARTGLTPAAVD